jgi:L-fuculose-phosphate aldolase
MIAVGDSLPSALALAIEVESLAEMYWRALQLGEPRILPTPEMQEVLRRFADYSSTRRFDG